MRKKIGKICIKLFFVIIGLIVAFIIFEVAVRVLGLAQQTAGLYQSDKLIGSKHIPNAHGWWRKKEFKTELKFNLEGFRDIDHSVDKPHGVYRVIVLGDSYVEAFQVPLENTFHKILERRLNENAGRLKYEVLNFGVSGFGLPQDYLALKHYGMKYRPDLVILAVTTGNDIRNAHPELERDSSKPYFVFDSRGELQLLPFHVNEAKGIQFFIANKIFFPQSYIFLAQTLRPLWWQFKAKKKMAEEVKSEVKLSPDSYVYAEKYSKAWKEAWEYTLALIKKMKEELSGSGIEFLVVSLTDSDSQIDGSLQKYLEENAKDMKWDMDRPVKILDRFCREKRIGFLPLLYGFRKEFNRTHEKFHFTYDGHWNKRGHELAADIIYNKIVSEGYIK